MTREDPDDQDESRAERLAAHKRYNMKTLGRLVDSNRLTGVARPTEAAPRREQLDTDGSDPGTERVEEPGVLFDYDELRGDDPFSADPADRVESIVDDTDRLLAAADRMNIPIRLSGSGGAGTGLFAEESDRVARDRTGDGVDRTEMGGAVTRTGLSVRLDGPPLTASGLRVRSHKGLARQMLDGELGPGGRISDPRDVPGIVLDLAKDVPASVAVSVVRIDEEVEIVGDSVDPSIDPAIFTVAFSEVFRSVGPAARALQDGPLGQIRDVVIEGDKMDLILRPLGSRYYLMVLEDRTDPQANLALTRMRMESIAPAMAAILAQQDGEV